MIVQCHSKTHANSENYKTNFFPSYVNFFSSITTNGRRKILNKNHQKLFCSGYVMTFQRLVKKFILSNKPFFPRVNFSKSINGNRCRTRTWKKDPKALQTHVKFWSDRLIIFFVLREFFQVQQTIKKRCKTGIRGTWPGRFSTVFMERDSWNACRI